MELRPGYSEHTSSRDEVGPKGRPEPELARMLYQVAQMYLSWAKLNRVDQTRQKRPFSTQILASDLH